MEKTFTKTIEDWRDRFFARTFLEIEARSEGYGEIVKHQWIHPGPQGGFTLELTFRYTGEDIT